MKWLRIAAVVALAAIAPVGMARAAAPVAVAFGTSWDGPAYSLQNIINNYLGGSGLLNAYTDYIGHDAGELDPWFWVGPQVPALLITEVAGNANNNVLGWYKETLSMPIIDGVDDGIVFNGPAGPGSSTLITFPGGTQKFGFWLNPNGPFAATNAPEPEKFFSNRFYNDLGPSGAGALHVPTDGDVQMLVYDVSQWKGANTWLVCVEDLDSGARTTSCCSGTDNDFNDLVFQVRALGATPNQTLTFGALKAKYRP